MLPPTRGIGDCVDEGGGGGTGSLSSRLESPSAITPLSFVKRSSTGSTTGSGAMPFGTSSGGTSDRGVSTLARATARGGGAGGSGSATTWINSVAVLGAGSSSVAKSGAITAAHTAMTWTTMESAIVQVRIRLLYGGRAGVALI